MLKRLFVIAAVVVVLLLVAVVALPFVIDVNRFRPELEAKASAAVGRKVTLGPLSLSLRSGKVVASDITVADDPAFSTSPFLTAKSVRIGVEVKPLLMQHKLNVIGIAIDQPQISLMRNPDGTWNFSSLNKGQIAPKDASHKIAPTSVSVAALSVHGGTLTVSYPNSTRPAQVYNNVNVEAVNVSATTRFGFHVATELPGGGSADLSGKVGPISTTDAARTTFEAALKAKDVHLASFADAASGIEGIADLDEALISDGATLEAAGELSGAQLKFSPTATPFPKPLSIKHIIDFGMGPQSGNMVIKNSDIAMGRAHLLVTGTVQTDSGVLNLKLHGTKMPLDDLQPLFTVLKVTLPMHAHFRGGALTGDVTWKGTGAAPIVAGSIQIYNTTMVGFNLGEKLGSMAKLTGKAALKPDTDFIQLTAKFVATNAGTKVDPLRSDIVGIGVSEGKGTVDPKGNQDFKLIANPTGGVAGSITKMSTAGNEGKGWVPVSMKGTSADPIFIADSKTAAHNALVGTTKGVGHAIGSIFHKKTDEEKQADTDKKAADKTKK